MTKLIVLNNKKCQIVSDDASLIRRLRVKLSFKMTGVEYTPAYKNGWSGITYLLSKNNKFDLGLLHKVKDFLANNAVNYAIDDLRPPKEIFAPIDLSETLAKYDLVPRDHQLRILDAVDKSDRGIIRAATGSGKTVCIALVTAKFNKPTIVYVIGLDLLDQFHKLFSKLFNEEIGYIGNGICEPKRITIASIWTIGKALNLDDESIIQDDDEFEKEIPVNNKEKILNCLSEAKVHILDECHVATTKTINEIYKNIDPEYIYGFSGTPFRDDNTDLLVNGVLGEKIIDVSASELIEKGLLAQPVIKFIAVPRMSATTAPYQTVYKDYIVDNIERNNLIIKAVQDLLNKKYTPLVLFKQIRHGSILLELMQNAGIKCAMLYGNDPLDRRSEVKDMLINKDINVILASTIFDLGVDIPSLSALVLCGGGKSSIRALQRIGRVIRMYKNKKYAAIVDFYDQVKFLKKHSMRRYSIYSSEPGFRVIKCKEMKV
jgi:superfamily II DNA or RNA helicase